MTNYILRLLCEETEKLADALEQLAKAMAKSIVEEYEMMEALKEMNQC